MQRDLCAFRRFLDIGDELRRVNDEETVIRLLLPFDDWQQNLLPLRLDGLVRRLDVALTHGRRCDHFDDRLVLEHV